MERAWEIRVDLTDSEFRYALRRFWLRTRLPIFAILIGAFVVWSLVAWTLYQQPLGIDDVIVFVAMSFVGLASYVLYMRRMTAERNRLDERAVVYRVGPDGLSISSQLGCSELKWRAFLKIWRFSRTWLLFIGKYQFLVIPTHVMDADLRAFIGRSVRLGSGLPKCRECGYDLRGQQDARCPECGTVYPPEVLQMTK